MKDDKHFCNLALMKIIIAPDKFKGSLSSFEVCNAINKGFKETNRELEVKKFPMADGGDGFANVMQHYLHTTTVYCDTVDPLGRKITVSYQWDEKNRIAIIEMAAASGLVLLKESEHNPLATSTFGTGLMINDAISRGSANIVLGLGGSATNDAGTGILAALGFKFSDANDLVLQPSGENLLKIKKIIVPAYRPKVKIEIACDVQNVLFGRQGAAHVYAPQKGADYEQVENLEQGLINFAGVIKSETGKDISTIPGTGAAGGIAASLLAFFHVEMKKGIDMIVKTSNIKDQLNDADLVITGEGKIDEQSSEGKVVGSIAALAKQYGIPCVAVCGMLLLDENGIRNLGLKKVLAIQHNKITKEFAMKNAAGLLVKKAAGIFDDL